MRYLILCLLVLPAVACSAEVIFEDDGGGSGSTVSGPCANAKGHAELVTEAFTKCTNCHSSLLTGAARNAAPIEANWDDYEGAKAQRAKIKQRILDGTMPQPGYPQLTKAERAELLLWANCGGPS
jgi:hypothetical protein